MEGSHFMMRIEKERGDEDDARHLPCISGRSVNIGTNSALC